MKTTKKRAKGRSLRVVLLTVVLAALALALFAGTALAAPPWSDADDAYWAGYSTSGLAITSAKVAAVAGGYPDGTFKPGLAVTRGQFAKMAVDGLGASTADPATPTFSDVAPGDTFFPWVEGAYAAGIIGGYDDGTFRPDTPVSRQQANSILGLFLAGKELELTGHIRGDLGTYGSLNAWHAAEGAAILAAFSDETSLASVHRPATAYLVYHNVVQGSARSGGLYLDPGSSLTRAQAVVLILRVKATTFVTSGLHLHVTGITNPATAGTASGVTVTVVDEANAVVVGYTGTVHFTSTDGAAVLPANHAFTALDAGTHTFAGGVTLKTAGSRTVTATDTGTASITGSQTVTVNAGVATQLIIETAADGSGTAIGATSVIVGDHFHAYAITRDAYGNFVGNPSATWTLTGRTGGVATTDLAPGTGTSSVFTGHLVGTATVHAVAGLLSDDTGVVTVTAAAGVATQLSIEDEADGSGDPIGATSLIAGDHFHAYAIVRDAHGNFLGNPSVTWSLTDRDPLTGGVATSDLSTLSGTSTTFTGHLVGEAKVHAVVGLLSDSTGLVTVNHGAATQLNIETEADGTGSAIGAKSVTAGNHFDAYAITRDFYGNFVANPSATWSLTDLDPLTGGVVIGDLSATTGASTTFTGHLVGKAKVHAVVGLLSDSTGLVTVNLGPATQLRIEDAADGTGSEIGAMLVTAGSHFDAYAITRDAGGNFLANPSVTWSVTDLAPDPGGVVIGDLSATTGASTIFTGHLVGDAKVHAVLASPSLNDYTGLVTVTAGTATQLTIETAADGTGSEIGGPVVTAGDHFDAYAITRDFYGNFVGNPSATWSLTAPLTGGVATSDLSTLSGPSTTFTGHLVGTADALHAVFGLLDDYTWPITVNLGPATQLRIEDAADGTGSEIGAMLVTAGSHFDAYAITRDAGGNFLANPSVTWSVTDLAPDPGGVVIGDLSATTGASTTLTGHLVGDAKVHAVLASPSLDDYTGLVTVTAGTATQLNIETAADGTGSAIGGGFVTAGNHFDAYAITRDFYDNFVANPSVTWSVTDLAPDPGGVATSDLSTLSGASTIFTGHLVGDAKLHAVFGLLDDYTGIIVVQPGAVTHLHVDAPASATVSDPFTVTVTAKDAYENTVTGYRGTIAFASSDSGGPTLPTNYIFQSGDSGTKDFTNGVTLVTTGSRTVSATDTVSSSITGFDTVNVGSI